MLTIFTTCKPFLGHNAVIQRNAIRSWTLLDPGVEVILLGDDEGTAEVAQELGVRHIPEVDRNEYGTPLMNSIFAKAQDAAAHDIMAYVNADIILMGDFVQALKRVKARGFRRFMILGPRWDLDVRQELDFGTPLWERNLLTQVDELRDLHPPGGIDYFVFTKGVYQNVPPFAIGRQVWGHWLVYHARELGIPMINAAKVVRAVHQNHDYSHHPDGILGISEGIEVQQNRAFAPTWIATFDYMDATWELLPDKLKRTITLENLGRRVYTESIFHPWLNLLLAPVRASRQIVKATKVLREALMGRSH